jgi:hypothetical protein
MRHVLQLAAIKRLQARGRTLAEIQEALLGATDDQLVEVAEPAVTPVLDQVPAAAPAPVAFWRQPPAAADTVTKVVHGIRLGDSVTVVLDGAGRVPDDAELAELQAAAAPLLAAIDRLGLSSRKERR